MSIHDQVMGGNVLKKEMPNGAEMAIHSLVVGDPTMSAVSVLHCFRDDYSWCLPLSSLCDRLR